MPNDMFHVYRNTPLGRETLMQSVYFCSRLDLSMTVYIPEAKRFMMYFEHDAVQVDLDGSYLTAPETAEARVRATAAEAGVSVTFIHPKNRTASDLPDLPTHFGFMCCPRSVSDCTAKIGLGYIGPKVRRIIRSAGFPVLMTTPLFKPWSSIAVLFGGSDSALNALRNGIQFAERAGVPLDLFIQLEQPADFYVRCIESAGLDKRLSRCCRQWRTFDNGDFSANLYDLPHDALVFSGAYGHGLLRNLIFGSKMEVAQSTLTNSMLVSGPQAVAHLN